MLLLTLPSIAKLTLLLIGHIDLSITTAKTGSSVRCSIVAAGGVDALW